MVFIQFLSSLSLSDTCRQKDTSYLLVLSISDQFDFLKNKLESLKD